MPVGVGDVQRTEMKKAFYAGAFSLFKILMIETADGEDEPTEANIDMMKDVEADIKNYMATILRD